MPTIGRIRRPTLCVVAVLSVAVAAARCGNQSSPGPALSGRAPSTLRLGISNAPSQSAERGVRQVLSNLATEGLLRVNPEGRLEPLLAEKWQQSQDGLHLNISLRPNVRFHDGTAVTADAVAEILRSVLPKNLRSIFDD